LYPKKLNHFWGTTFCPLPLYPFTPLPLYPFTPLPLYRTVVPPKMVQFLGYNFYAYKLINRIRDCIYYSNAFFAVFHAVVLLISFSSLLFLIHLPCSHYLYSSFHSFIFMSSSICLFLFSVFYSFPVITLTFLLPYFIPSIFLLISVYSFSFSDLLPLFLHIFLIIFYVSSCSYLFIFFLFIFFLMSFITASHPSTCSYSCFIPLLFLNHVLYFSWCSYSLTLLFLMVLLISFIHLHFLMS